MQAQILLASISPRRREILELLQIPFEVFKPHFDEVSSENLSPNQEVLSFAYEKAKSIITDFQKSIINSEPIYIIGSDTLIEFEGQKIGKPKDEREAQDILLRLSNRPHQILTSLSILNLEGKKLFEHLERVKVHFKKLSAEEIVSYLNLDKPFDKAGAYSIQENASTLIQSFEGDFLAAVGFPLKAFGDFLAAQSNPSFNTVHLTIDEIYKNKNFSGWEKIMTQSTTTF